MVTATSSKVTRAHPVAGEATGGASLGPSMVVKNTIDGCTGGQGEDRGGERDGQACEVAHGLSPLERARWNGGGRTPHA